MLRNFSISILLITVLAISSCAGIAGAPTDPSKTLRNEMTFNAPIDKVWDATIAALTEMGATIGTINRENGVLNTQEILVDPRRANDLVRTSAIFYGSYFGCKYQLNILEKSIDKNQTKVTVVSRIQVQRGIASSAGVSKNWYAIQSNGLLEKTLFDKIQKNL